jgi:hypothetical protein
MSTIEAWPSERMFLRTPFVVEKNNYTSGWYEDLDLEEVKSHEPEVCFCIGLTSNIAMLRWAYEKSRETEHLPPVAVNLNLRSLFALHLLS